MPQLHMLQLPLMQRSSPAADTTSVLQRTPTRYAPGTGRLLLLALALLPRRRPRLRHQRPNEANLQGQPLAVHKTIALQEACSVGMQC